MGDRSGPQKRTSRASCHDVPDVPDERASYVPGKPAWANAAKPHCERQLNGYGELCGGEILRGLCLRKGRELFFRRGEG